MFLGLKKLGVRMNNFVVGDMVRWFETYSDIQIAKDYGVGIIVDVSISDCYGIKYESYKVYRAKKCDYMFFGKKDLEKLQGEKNGL